MKISLAVSSILLMLICSGIVVAQTPTPTPTPSIYSILAPSTTPPPEREVCDDPFVKKPGKSPLGHPWLRKLAPAVGTGGTIGGPTGLFTVYDGQTLRPGDYTFSYAYSNYDRDPGNVDLTEMPLSYNVGLPYRLELFFSTDVYRGIKVNNPLNLSSFYLPNSQLFFGPNQLGSGPAFVLAPINNMGISGGLFRPANNQPFVPFPFVGQPSGNFGILGPPAFTGILGAQNAGGGNAALFPGIGSVVGSILPGIVFTTTTADGLTTPLAFTTAPSYLPDAPFVNRLYGESSFNTFTIGVKIRFSDRQKSTGFGIIPMYRIYADRANSSSGFNMLQRGSSPGGNNGDFGLVGFFSQRIEDTVRLSANIGYFFNSNPRSSAFGSGKVTLLDRPNEFIYGFAADFFIKKFEKLQPIIELRGTKYTGERTPNALENNPVDLLIGARFFKSESLGFSIAYRRHLNQQNNIGPFNGAPLPGDTRSSNADGFMVQIWKGYRRPRNPPTIIVKPKASPTIGTLEKLVLPCPNPNESSASGACPQPNPFNARIPLEAIINKADGTPSGLTVKRWEKNGGQIDGTGNDVVWDLSGVAPSKPGNPYVAAAVFEDEDGYEVRGIFCLPVEICGDCAPPTPPPTTISCPTSISVSNLPSVVEGTPATFTANVTGLPSGVSITHRWELSAGKIISGEGTASITVDTTGLGGQTITAKVTVDGLDPSCANTAQGNLTTAKGEILVTPTPTCKLFDKYGAIPYNDEKARLDNFVIDLNSNPSLDAHIITYGGGTLGRNIGTRRNPVRGAVTAQYRIKRALDYMKESRGYGRQIRTMEGSLLGESTVELYICPANAQPSVNTGSSIQNPSPPTGEGKRPQKRGPRPKPRLKKGRPIRGS